jgi:hypothetical protein
VKPGAPQDRPSSGPANATYVYCLVHSKTRPSLRGAPDSVPGAGSLRLLPIDRDIWAAVADAPLEHFTGDALQQEMQDVEGISRHALAHASTIEFFFRRAPVIPLKLLTLFSSDERVTVHVRSRLATLKRMFASLGGREEWAVRIIAGEVEREAARTLDSGRAYLTLKKRQHEQSATTSRKTVRALDSALRSLGRVAVRSRKETFPAAAKGRPYAAGASFLVDARRRAAWTKQIRSVTAAMDAAGHRLEASGPWPPYHFVSR